MSVNFNFSKVKGSTNTDCPSCGYKNALSVSFKDGQELYYCHAGCPQDSLWRVILGEGRPTYRQTMKTNPRLFNESQSDFIKKLWKMSVVARGTPVETYLVGRFLTGSIPQALRYLPDQHHKPTGTRWPLMIAKVTDHNGCLRAVHRTYLRHNGNGKAPVEPNKMTLGPVGGYAVHLASAGKILAVSEGIETGLAVMQSTGLPVWVGISAGGMRNLLLPPLPLATEIVIAADADPVGIKAAKDAAIRWQCEGRRVRISKPPTGKDFNDVICNVGSAE